MTNQDNTKENKPTKIVFAEGCFDEFDGTQEELNELISQLTAMAESGELLEKSVPVDLDNIDDEDRDIISALNQKNVRH